MFTLLGDTAFVRASVSPSMERHSWQWGESPGCSLLLVQPAPLSPVPAEAAGAAVHRELPRSLVGLRLGMDCSFPLPWTEAGEEFGSKQVALSSSWPMSPQWAGFWRHLQWGAGLWGRCMRCLEQSVGTGILPGGTLSWSRRMLHPSSAHLLGLLCSSMETEIQSPVRGLIMGLHSLPSVLLPSVPVTPVPHGLPAPWVKLLPVRARGAEQHLVFHTGWAVGSQTFPSSQKNLWPPGVAKCPAWHVARPRPSQLTP